jgi:hypothetical protein
MKTKSFFYLLLIISLILGCQNKNSEPEAKTKLESKPKPSLIIVLGIDETGSYKLWPQVKNAATVIIKQLEPGDIFYFRRITDASYLDSCTIFRLELPVIEESKNDNPFNRKSKNRKSSQIMRINSLKREALHRLAAVKFTNAKRTDIFGFLAAAGDRFSLAPKSFHRLLIIASDLKDNIGYKAKLDLSGAYVAVIGFQTSKDPAETQRLKDYWIKKLNHAGAVKVIFLSIEEKFSLNRFQE